MSDSVCIVGLGLIGGSLGMKLRRAGWHVSYVDPAVSLAAARGADAAEERLETISGPIVVLATPVDAATTQLTALRGSAAHVTSACSVMRPLLDAADGVDFIAGHPFAGSERRGLEAADPMLFADRPWFLSRNDLQIERLVADAGARPVIIDADEHDRAMALTSHLPQVISTALASLLRDVDPQFIGSGAASLLRLAGSAHDVWRPIIDANRDNLDASVAQLIATMRNLTADDFARANDVYEKLRR